MRLIPWPFPWRAPHAAPDGPACPPAAAFRVAARGSDACLGVVLVGDPEARTGTATVAVHRLAAGRTVPAALLDAAFAAVACLFEDDRTERVELVLPEADRGLCRRARGLGLGRVPRRGAVFTLERDAARSALAVHAARSEPPAAWLSAPPHPFPA